MTEPEVLFERRGAAGIITLNRPQVLNAFTIAAVQAIRPKLREWAADPAVTRVVIQAAGGKAFAAGGDIRTVVEWLKAGRFDEAMEFWREEYLLNVEIKRFPKPYIALVEGICMGGGVGLSVHGSHRVAGDRYLFAMPEVAIGFFPDVGATYFLPRLPGRSGAYLGLTAARIGPGEGMGLGLATHRVPTARFPELVDALGRNEDVGATLRAFSIEPEADKLAPRMGVIDRAFAGATVEAILDNLDREAKGTGEDAEFAKAQAAGLRAKSPTSLKIALEQVKQGARMDFAECMRTEYRIVQRIVRGHDFIEGVRAAVLDKDNAPRWNPASLADVKDADVAAHFAPLAPAAEELPL
ncbi:MAG: enoyl-CoA hydratase/isomerase family protein [Bradyrhizobiaceae bacterium]|nr:enoyl-CoA hydratase/isomerase family protein [Bradyrhizobiaceae bacterium]